MKNLKEMAFFNLVLAIVLNLSTSVSFARPPLGSRASVPLGNVNVRGNNLLVQAATPASIRAGQSSGQKVVIELMQDFKKFYDISYKILAHHYGLIANKPDHLKSEDELIQGSERLISIVHQFRFHFERISVAGSDFNFYEYRLTCEQAELFNCQVDELLVLSGARNLVEDVKDSDSLEDYPS
jgi:hypothetical protein